MSARYRMRTDILRRLANDYEAYGLAVWESTRKARIGLEQELDLLLRKYADYPAVTSIIHQMKEKIRNAELHVRLLRERSEEIGRNLRRAADEADRQQEKERELIRRFKAGVVRIHLPLSGSANVTLLHRSGEAHTAGGSALGHNTRVLPRTPGGVIRGINKKVDGSSSSIRGKDGQADGLLKAAMKTVSGVIVRTVTKIGEGAAVRLNDMAPGFGKLTRDAAVDVPDIREFSKRIIRHVRDMLRNVRPVLAGSMPVRTEVYVDPMTFGLDELGSGVFGGIEGKFYGGDQDWFLKRWQQKSGCGPVAAANILAYLAFRDEKYRALYGYEDLSKENFTAFMNEVIKAVSPVRVGNLSFGIPSLSSFAGKVEKFAASRGVELKAQWAEKRTGNHDQAVEYIRRGLEADLPVALIVHWNVKWMRDEELSGFQYHWVTVMKMHYDEEEDAWLVTVSSWGEEYTLNFKDVWNHSTYAGVIYFK